MLQHVFLAIRVTECHILEFNIAVQGLPVLPQGMEGITVFCRDSRCIRHIRSLREQPRQPLDVDLNLHKGCIVGDDHLQRFDHVDSIVDKDRQGTDLQKAVAGQMSSLLQHYSERQC